MQQPKLGRFQIVSELGRGAMGVVYKALDPELARTLAIKTVNMAIEREGMEHYEARFYQEARAAAGLNHPNIVTVYDIGKSGDVAFMAMEYIEGVELRTLLEGGQSLALPRAVSIAAQVAEALAYAHGRGVVHRDIKPANIMVVREGPVKITDFGIARMRAAEVQTQTGTMLGSPKYMSPEQVLGKRADHRADIFSLGVILYEMLTGTAPFSGENITALMYQIVNFAPPAPSTVNHAVPEFLDYVVAKMIAKQLEERYQDSTEVARDLREIERQLAASAPAGPMPPLPAAALSPDAQPSQIDTESKTAVLGQEVVHTRRSDSGETTDVDAGPVRVSRNFDSQEATQRLAKLTAMGGATFTSQSATQALRTLQRGPVRRWSRRDALAIGASALAGLLVAALITRR